MYTNLAISYIILLVAQIKEYFRSEKLAYGQQI